jgi:serine protease Do
MTRFTLAGAGLLAGLLAFAATAARAADDPNPFHEVAAEVNSKMVKLFGSGGFQRLNSYGTGVLVSPDGHVLTVAGPLLDTRDLRVHLPDGRRLQGKVVALEPDLDAAIVKIEPPKGSNLELPFFDIAKAAAAPPAQAGDWVLGFSNQFQIATRDEPMSVQRGVVASYSKLLGRRGIFEAPYHGEVYFIDAITNNPGAGGGALTTRKGDFLGLIGKELRNTLTDTWVNYAVPAQAKVEIRFKDKVETVTLDRFVREGIAGKYNPPPRDTSEDRGPGGYTGIILVPNPVPRTPPYIEDVLPSSPAATAGLRPDDLIVYVDGNPVSSIKAYKELMSRTRPGATIQLEIRRGEKLMTIEMKLAENPQK